MSRPPAVARVLERVTRTTREHGMLAPGQRVLVACSGGPDSVCLLYALWLLRRLLRVRLEVFHFDHRLRGDSRLDAAYVRRLASRLGLPFHLRVAQDRPPRGGSVEVWARSARLLAAASVMRQTGAARLATGHTLDDQAETVLMALVLGWGPDGLAGIRPVNGAEVRPLLDVTREEVMAFCRALHLRPRQDPTNLDLRFLRNALRHRGIPALERATGRELKRTFARAAELLRLDQEVLWEEAVRTAGRLVEPTSDGCRLPVAGLLALPRAISGRVVRRAFQVAGASWTHADVDAALDLAAGRPGRHRDLSGGSTVRREREYVVISRASPGSRG